MMRALGGCGAGEAARADTPAGAPEGVDGRRRFEQSVAQARAGGRDRPPAGIVPNRASAGPGAAGALPSTLETLAAAPLPVALLAALGPAGSLDGAAAGPLAAAGEAAPGSTAGASGTTRPGESWVGDRPGDTAMGDGATREPLTGSAVTGAGPRADDPSVDQTVGEGLPGTATHVDPLPWLPRAAASSDDVNAVSATTAAVPDSPCLPADARVRTASPAGEPTRREGARPIGPESERVGEPAADALAARPQAAATAFEPMQSAARPDGRAEVLAQWILSKLPLEAALDRTVTLTFPGASVPIEQIVLSREAGVLRLWVTARSEGREQVQAALTALGDRLRSRGLRVGALALA